MRAVLRDTNVWSWTLIGTQGRTDVAQTAFEETPDRYLGPGSVCEVSQKAQLGQWSEKVAVLPRLRSSSEALAWASPDAEICLLAGSMAWSHRDPFDRAIAATALVYGIPIISADKVFDGVVTRIW